MRNFRIPRRTFLAGAGASALGTLLRPIMAHAQTGASPQRLLVIHRPCGTSLGTGVPGDAWWWPQGGTVANVAGSITSSTGWTASPILSSFTDGKIAALQSKMVVLKHLNNARNMGWNGDKHGSGFLAFLTPAISGDAFPESPTASSAVIADPNNKAITAVGASADQLFLNQIPALQGPPGAPCPVPSVTLTSSTESSDQTNDWHCVKCLSYAEQGTGASAQLTPIWPTASPLQAFNNYFASGLMGMSAANIQRITAENKSVLDFDIAGLTSLSAQVPKSQLPKVQAHLAAIRQLETTIAAQATGPACTAPTAPATLATPMGGWLSPTPDTLSSQNEAGGFGGEYAPLDAQTYPMWQQHKEIIKTMFQCDLTRVITFTFGYGNNSVHFSNVLNVAPFVGMYKDMNGNALNDTSGHHDISHNQGTDPKDAQYIIDKFYCDRTAELLAEMDATMDVNGGTLLDNTMVVFMSEISNGNAHGAVDMPVVLFGGKFLKMNGGSMLTLSNTTQTPAQSVSKPDPPYSSDLWVTIAQKWGYNLAAFGDKSWNTGPISGIFGT
jgi:hypothetical protein